MKLLTLAFALSLTFSVFAETTTTTTTKTETKEIPSKEDKGKIKASAEKISSETKKLLRKVGRKSMDETCEFTESKADCDKQKAEHKALTEKEAVEGVPAN